MLRAASRKFRCQGFGGGQKHIIRQTTNMADGYPEPDTGKDEKVVTLPNLVFLAIVLDRIKRTAGSHDGPSTGPADGVLRQAFTLGSWIGNR